MSKTPTTGRDAQHLSTFLKSYRGDAIPYRQVLDLIAKVVPFTEGMVITSMPRAGLQIVQPARLPDPLFKTYARESHRDDRATWQAVIHQKPMRGPDAWGNAEAFNSSLYARQLMRPNGLQHVAAAPLRAPVFVGFQGALHLYRSAEHPDFTDADLRHLGEIAGQLNDTLDQLRASRRPAVCTAAVWSHQPAVRQFIFDGRLRPQLAKADFSQFDDDLRHQLLQHARYRLEHLEGPGMVVDRLQVADTHGDLWTFRVVTYPDYPALGNGPYIFFCLQPEACDWAVIRPTDFQADPELSRLIPALRFMQQEFHRGPTLGEISKQVHLSPFHFHRRFTELLGLTPKHLLLESQIFEAKRQLVSRQKELSAIATDCGFAHQSHFTSRFKQATGLTPTRWRRFAMDLEIAASK